MKTRFPLRPKPRATIEQPTFVGEVARRWRWSVMLLDRERVGGLDRDGRLRARPRRSRNPRNDDIQTPRLPTPSAKADSSKVARHFSGWALGLALLLAPSLAHADPIVLRGVNVGPSVGLVAGAPDASLGAWITRRIGVAFEWHPPSAIGASVGTRLTLAGGERGLGLDAFGAVGLLGLRYDPGLAISATLALQGRVRREWGWFSLGIASPMALQVVGGVEARIPLQLELAFSIRAGRVWFGAQGGAGLVFVPGISPSPALQGSITATIPWNE